MCKVLTIYINDLGHVFKQDTWQSAYKQSNQFEAYKHRSMFQSYALSLACAMSSRGSYRIFLGLQFLSAKT